MQRLAHTLPRGSGHVEAQIAAGHAMRLHTLRLCAARMVPHHVAVWHVAEEVDAVGIKPVHVKHSHHLLGHDDGSSLAERLGDVEVCKGRCQEREVLIEWPASPVDGFAQRPVHSVVGEHVCKFLRLPRQYFSEEGKSAPTEL